MGWVVPLPSASGKRALDLESGELLAASCLPHFPAVCSGVRFLGVLSLFPHSLGAVKSYTHFICVSFLHSDTHSLGDSSRLQPLHHLVPAPASPGTGCHWEVSLTHSFIHSACFCWVGAWYRPDLALGLLSESLAGRLHLLLSFPDSGTWMQHPSFSPQGHLVLTPFLLLAPSLPASIFPFSSCPFLQ